MSIIDNNGAFITPAVAKLAENLLRQDPSKADYVLLHPMQMLACLSDGLEQVGPSLERKTVLPEGPWESYNTLLGIKIVQDQNFPEDMIEFRDKQGRMILQLKNLAVAKLTNQ